MPKHEDKDNSHEKLGYNSSEEDEEEHSETQEDIIERLKEKLSEPFVYRQAPKLIEYQSLLKKPNGGLASKEFKPLNAKAKVLKTSMRFVPLLNNTPNETGCAKDPPYLFSVKGKNLQYKPDAPKIQKSPLPSEQQPTPVEESTPPTPPPTAVAETFQLLGLECPHNASMHVKRIHQELLVAYMEYNNKMSEQAPQKDRREDIVFYGPGKKEKEEAEEKYEPAVDYEGPVPFFPDMETLLGKPFEGRAGYMDSLSIFHPADMGDSIPFDAVIGYKSPEGLFQNIMSVSRGVDAGYIGVRFAQPNKIGLFVKTSGDPIPTDTVSGKQTQLQAISSKGKVKKRRKVVKMNSADGLEKQESLYELNQTESSLEVSISRLSVRIEVETGAPNPTEGGPIEVNHAENSDRSKSTENVLQPGNDGGNFDDLAREIMTMSIDLVERDGANEPALIQIQGFGE